MPLPTRILLGVILTSVAASAIVWGQAKNEKKKLITRAKLPTFTSADTKGIFYADVFKEALVGERPTNLAAPAGKAPTTTGGGTDEPGDSGGTLHNWHDIIAGEVIEDEIKKLSTVLGKEITTPTKFNGGGYQDARVNFTMLSMLFAISGEHKDDVRWKKDAPELRDYFARAASGAKVGSPQSYSQAKNAKQQLEDLVRGTAFASSKPGERKTNWEFTADRSPLMQRLELSANETIAPWVASAGEFKANKDALLHEASLVAAIGEVLAQEGMTDADDDGYQAHAKKMRDAAREIVTAIELDNYDAARKASGTISQSCADCHDDWR